MSVKRFIPDFKYLRGNSTVTIFLNDYPDNSPVGSPLGPFTITSTTDKIDTRARGRLVSIQLIHLQVKLGDTEHLDLTHNRWKKIMATPISYGIGLSDQQVQAIQIVMCLRLDNRQKHI